MKLWLLRPVSGDEEGFWSPWFDKAFGFVVRAPDEKTARALAQASGGDETRDYRRAQSRPAWTSADHATCVELTTEGPSGVVIQDFRAA